MFWIRFDQPVRWYLRLKSLKTLKNGFRHFWPAQSSLMMVAMMKTIDSCVLWKSRIHLEPPNSVFGFRFFGWSSWPFVACNFVSNKYYLLESFSIVSNWILECFETCSGDFSGIISETPDISSSKPPAHQQISWPVDQIFVRSRFYIN